MRDFFCGHRDVSWALKSTKIRSRIAEWYVTNKVNYCLTNVASWKSTYTKDSFLNNHR